MALLIACVIAFTRLDGAARWAAVAIGAGIEIAEAAAMIWWSRRAPSVVGNTGLIDAVAIAATDCRPDGRVRVRGETWSARCVEGCDAGQSVRITDVRGLELDVTPLRPDPPAAATTPG